MVDHSSRHYHFMSGQHCAGEGGGGWGVILPGVRILAKSQKNCPKFTLKVVNLITKMRLGGECLTRELLSDAEGLRRYCNRGNSAQQPPRHLLH